MDKAKPQPKLQPRDEHDILGIYDLDTVLKHAAEGKRQIARGECFTPDQVDAVLRYRIANRGK